VNSRSIQVGDAPQAVKDSAVLAGTAATSSGQRPAPVLNPPLLNSWKEIANYLGRGVRTVQRWERDLNLPVHRPKGKDRSAVLALREELDQWLRHTPVRSLQGEDNGNGIAGNGEKDLAPVLLQLARELLAQAERLSTLDGRDRAEAGKLASAVRETVRVLTLMTADEAAKTKAPPSRRSA
jgi:hypothetical protein